MKKILVPVDFSKVTDRVIKTAQALAKAFHAELALVHVAAPEPAFIGYEPGPQTVRDDVARRIHDEHKELQDLEHNLQGGGLKVTALLVQGYVVEKILQECDRLGCDMIVMGSHGHGALYHLLVGSVAEGVLRKARCPVTLVPADEK